MKGWIAGIVVIAVIALLFVGYNIYRHPAMFRSLSDNSLSDSPVEELRTTEVSGEDGKALIVYFSWSTSGNTEKMATYIQEQTGGDLLELEPLNPYPTDYEECGDVALVERDENARPEIANLPDSIEEYDTVFVGYPIWNADLPMPLYTFLEEYDFSGKTIIPFTTHGGSGFSRTIQTISELQPNATVISDGLSISRNSVSGAEYDVVKWVNGMNLTTD